MKFKFTVVATSFASIDAVISAAGFFSGHDGVGWGFALMGLTAFVLGIVVLLSK